MRIKKLLALLLAAVMAMTLFAGCCSPSLLRLLLDLLQDQYHNVTVTAEADLDAALRAAVSEHDTIEDITAALAQALDKTVEFERLPGARAGDQTFSLVYKTGTDTEAIARQTYTDWNKILGALPAGGRYLADLAVRKSGGGYYILVNVTVQKGSGDGSSSGSHSSGNDGSGSEDENGGGENGYDGPDYEAVYDESNVLTGYKIYTNEGLQKVFFEDMTSEDKTLMEKRNGISGYSVDAGFMGLTITLNSGVYYEIERTFGLSPDGKFNLPFQGTLTSSDLNDPATINLSGCAMFGWVGSAGVYEGISGVSNVNFHVTKTIQGVSDRPINVLALYASAVAYVNTGTISNCNVTFAVNCGIDAKSEESITGAYAGGVVAYSMDGSITGCKVTGGKITVNGLTLVGEAGIGSEIDAGGIVGSGVTVSGCTAATTIDVDVDESVEKCYVGGIAGSCNGAASGNIYDSNVVTLNNKEPKDPVGKITDSSVEQPKGQYVGEEIGYQRN